MKKYSFILVSLLVSQVCCVQAMEEFEGLEKGGSNISSFRTPAGGNDQLPATGVFSSDQDHRDFVQEDNSSHREDAYQDWAAGIKLSQNFTAADFLQYGNVAELQRLLAIISEICPSSDSENKQVLFRDFSLNMAELEKEIAEEKVNLRQLSLLDFESLRKGSAFMQNDDNDFLLVQAFLQKLYAGNPTVPDNNAVMLKRIMVRVNELIGKSLILYDKRQLQEGSSKTAECAQLTPDFVRSQFIEPWSSLKEVKNAAELSSTFPWSDMARSCLKKTFSPGAAFISYLHALRPVLKSVLSIMSFTDAEELQLNLQKIKSSGVGINHAFRSGGVLIISVPEMLEIPAADFSTTVRNLLATRINIEANNPAAVESAMAAISSRIAKIANGDRVQQAVLKRSQSENKQSLEEFSSNKKIISAAALLNRILLSNARVPEDMLSEFYQETGFTPNELAATAGSPQAIKELIVKRHGSNINQPGFMAKKSTQILAAVQKLAVDERLKKVEEAAVHPFLQNLIRKQLIAIFGAAAKNFEIKVDKSQTIDSKSWLAEVHIFARSILLSAKGDGMLSNVPLSFDLKFQNLLLISSGNEDRPLLFKQKPETGLVGSFEINAASFQKIASNLVKKKKDITDHAMRLSDNKLYFMAAGGNFLGSVKIEINIGLEMKDSAFDLKIIDKKVSSKGLGGGKAKEIRQQIDDMEEKMKAKMPFNTATYGIVTDGFRLNANGLQISFHSNDNISNAHEYTEQDFTKIWPVVSGFLFGDAN